MPQDNFIVFSSLWNFNKDSIVFPCGEIMEWNREEDWFSKDETRYIFIKDKIVCIGNIDAPNTGVYVLCLNDCVPKDCLIRGWLLKDHFLISPKPNYESAQFLMRLPMIKSFFYEAFPTIASTWVSGVVVSKCGTLFALYDYEDDATVVFNEEMKHVKYMRCGSFPTDLQMEDDRIVLTMKGRWDQKEWKQTI